MPELNAYGRALQRIEKLETALRQARDAAYGPANVIKIRMDIAKIVDTALASDDAETLIQVNKLP